MMIQAPLPLLECPCVPLQDDEAAIAAVGAAIDSGQGGYAVAVNAEKILFYDRLPEMRAVIDRAALPYPDGFGAVLGLKWLHGVQARKIDMPAACLKGANIHGWRLFIIGATEDVSRTAAGVIELRYPNIRIVGRMNGYEAESEYFSAVIAARPQLVMVALGSPRQELFASALVDHDKSVFVVGCGGALDILAGRIKRAPRFLIHSGFEWLYRLVREPWRLKRQKSLPLFFLRLIKAALKKAVISPKQ